ncbi:MAG: murein L,D-transpeptidase [Prevotella sp.]|nr:murein L,D-transpeptidase [Prevotella sp.]
MGQSWTTIYITTNPCLYYDKQPVTRKQTAKFSTDFNKECIYPKGSAIFIHVKGTKGYTGGCIAFDEEQMIDILKNCDMSLAITVKNSIIEYESWGQVFIGKESITWPHDSFVCTKNFTS